jgi:capsular polysaccharide biosynthesis protein
MKSKYTFGDLFSHPFPRFVFDRLLERVADKESGIPEQEKVRVLAVKAICNRQPDVLQQVLREGLKQGDPVTAVTSIFQAAYRVASADDIVALAPSILSALEPHYPNKIRIERTEYSLARGMRGIVSALSESPELIPKQVILVDHSTIATSPLGIESVEVPPAEKFREHAALDQLAMDPGVDRSRIEKALSEWSARAESFPEHFRVYKPKSCILTALNSTPMIEAGPVLAALGPTLEHYHHARWVGATLAYPVIAEEIDGAIVLPRTGAGFYYHQVVDQLAAIMALHQIGYGNRNILVPDDLSKFAVFLASVGVDPSRIRNYQHGISARVSEPLLIPVVHHSRAKIFHAREWMLGKTRRIERPERKIYISRSKSKQRQMTNERGIEGIVRALGYEVLHFENMSVQDQISAVDGASHLVAPHGGGLANLLFARGPVRVLELIPESYFVEFFFRLAFSCGFPYSVYVGAQDQSKLQGVDKSAWKVDAKRFKEAMKTFEQG